jgi:hypothetical protein
MSIAIDHIEQQMTNKLLLQLLQVLLILLVNL